MNIIEQKRQQIKKIQNDIKELESNKLTEIDRSELEDLKKQYKSIQKHNHNFNLNLSIDWIPSIELIPYTDSYRLCILHTTAKIKKINDKFVNPIRLDEYNLISSIQDNLLIPSEFNKLLENFNKKSEIICNKYKINRNELLKIIKNSIYGGL